jgi:hypothetical protein
MATDTAFQTQYRQEFIIGFEMRQSLLRETVTTEIQLKGNTAVFLVADSNLATAVTRGVNGLIPARADHLVQNSCVLAEWHDLVRKTGFNIFASQSDQKKIMQVTTMGVINRKIDDDILGALANATLTTGAVGVTGSLNLIMKAKAILGGQQVPMGNNIHSVISPAFEAYLMQTKEFASAQYINNKPFEKTQSDDQPTAFRWAGVNFIVHARLTGIGTTAEICFMWHRAALGHAVDKDGLQTPVGYHQEQDYSWARASVYMGSQLLQTKGIVKMTHDGSAYVSG